MAPKKKPTKKSPKKEESDLEALLQQASDKELDATEKTLDRINFNSRILEVNRQAEALQADLRQLLQDHPDKAQGIAEEYYHLAQRSTKALNKMSVAVLGPLAEHQDEWPMMVGRATSHRTSDEQEAFLKEIGLAKQLTRPPSIDLITEPLTPPDVAFLLAAIVRSLHADRFDDSAAGFCLAKLREAKHTALAILVHKIKGTWKWDQSHVDGLKIALTKLKPLSRETLDDWINASIAVFVCVTRDAFENPRHPFKSWTESTTRRSKSKRGAIIDRLRDALSSAFRMARTRRKIRSTAVD